MVLKQVVLEEIKEKYPEIPLGRSKDLSNKKYGRLKVLYRTQGPEKEGYWICRCDCGNYCRVRARCLNQGSSKSCGCISKEIRKTQHHTPPENLIGKRFGKLVVIQPAKRTKGNPVRWICKCDCGKEKVVQANHLKSGAIQNCGCEKILSHGEHQIKELLKQANIKFLQEYTPLDLGFNGRYDFAILDPNDEILYFIEYDGKQHFNSYTGIYKSNREYDIIKNNYCYEIGIPLIRIPYTIKNISIEDLQLDTSKYIISESKEKKYYAL